jgi:hypothetical protein
MYIKQITLENIRSVKRFEMKFKRQAGWHVLIGDNGSGKSTIIRAAALALLGEDSAKALEAFEDFSNWLPPDNTEATINITGIRDKYFDKPANRKADFVSEIKIKRNGKVNVTGVVKPQNALWGDGALSGWFFAAYGPFRRLRGGESTFAHIQNTRPRIGACLTAFRDDVALTQLTAWLKDLALDSGKSKSGKTNKAKNKLQGIIEFINSAELLPGGAQLLNDIDSDGVKLIDRNGVKVSLYDMSDGYRSILSMTLDILRFMLETFDTNIVFSGGKEQTHIQIPGIVFIDEVDAHLHPTWQTEIGQWFTRYFPNIQFIVTTHSPIICRACGDQGHIWRLNAEHSGEVIGQDKNRLIYGNVLDAFGTEVFGQAVEISKDANIKLSRLGELNVKSMMGKLSGAAEKREYDQLKAIFLTKL